jgi:hypothetical protein
VHWIALGAVFFMPTGDRLRRDSTVALGPAQRWPLGVVVSVPLLLYQHWITFEVSMPTRVRWLVVAVVVPLSSCELSLAVLMSQSDRSMSIVERLLRSQSNRVSLFFLFFLPMISQGHSLVFFSSISMKHALSCVVGSKK